jgi:hypothetical protein
MRSQEGTSVILVLATIVLIILALAMLSPKVFGAEICMTRQQASIRYPGQHLYWHTLKHCWNNKPNQHFSPPPVHNDTDPNGNKMQRGELHQVILYPDLMASGGTSSSMMRAEPITGWPLILDADEERPVFLPWEQRIIFDDKGDHQ